MNRVDIIEKVNQVQQLQEYWKQIVRTHGIGDNRLRNSVMYRHAFMVAAREISALTYKAVGEIVERDHTSVIYAEKSHEGNIRFDSAYAKIYRNIVMDVSDIIVTDIDFISQGGLEYENKELRERLMKLARMNRELIVEKNNLITRVDSLEGSAEELRLELNNKTNDNNKLHKKLASIAW